MCSRLYARTLGRPGAWAAALSLVLVLALPALAAAQQVVQGPDLRSIGGADGNGATGENAGENLGSWLQSWGTWLFLGAIAISLAFLFAAQKYSKLVITAGVGLLASIFILNPANLGVLGDWLARVATGAGS